MIYSFGPDIEPLKDVMFSASQLLKVLRGLTNEEKDDIQRGQPRTFKFDGGHVALCSVRCDTVLW